jgi:hypothetical protein
MSEDMVGRLRGDEVMVLGCWGIGVEDALLKLFVVKIDLST